MIQTRTTESLAGCKVRRISMAHFDVLVVDDDNATRIGLSLLLTHAGLTVNEANDGATALRR